MTLKEILLYSSSIEDEIVLTQPIECEDDGEVFLFLSETSTITLTGEGQYRFCGLVFRHETADAPTLFQVRDAQVIFEDCVFEGATGGTEENLATAVYAGGHSRVVFRRCHFRDNDVHVRAEAQSQCEFQECLFQEARADGMRFSDECEVLLRACEISGSGWSGLTAEGTATVSLTGCTVSRNGCHGVELRESSRYLGRGNVIKENGQNGLYGEGESKSLAEFDELLGNGLAGLDLCGDSTALWTGAQSTHNTVHGFQLRESSRLTLVDGVASENLGSGIALFGSSHLEAQDLTVEANSLNGIQCAEGSRLVLNRSSVAQNKGAAASGFGKSRLYLEKSRFNDSGSHGIQVCEEGYALIRDCEVMDNARAAIVFAGETRGLVECSTLAHNLVDGLVTADSSRVTALENLIRSNGRDGVMVLSQNSVNLLENHPQKNGRHGIYAGPGSQPLVEQNLCEENGGEQLSVHTESLRCVGQGEPEQDSEATTIEVEGGTNLKLPFQPKEMEHTMLCALAKHGRLSEAALGKVAKTRRVGGAMENLIDRLNKAGMPLIRHDGNGPEGNIYALKIDTSRARQTPGSRTQNTQTQGREIC